VGTSLEHKQLPVVAHMSHPRNDKDTFRYNRCTYCMWPQLKNKSHLHIEWFQSDNSAKCWGRKQFGKNHRYTKLVQLACRIQIDQQDTGLLKPHTRRWDTWWECLKDIHLAKKELYIGPGE